MGEVHVEIDGESYWVKEGGKFVKISEDMEREADEAFQKANILPLSPRSIPELFRAEKGAEEYARILRKAKRKKMREVD